MESKEKLNFDVIKNKVYNKTNDINDDVTQVPQQQFRANKQHNVFTHFLKKDFRLTSDKRRIIGNDTLPYGWVD